LQELKGFFDGMLKARKDNSAKALGYIDSFGGNLWTWNMKTICLKMPLV
jgi:hypothetical protein